ncbi:hypothetical protein NC652_011209 [Populus alba x Populus x berolinensis]|uniref:Uncharacterized protein n=1 Tax=Populus alba x Populus x berolinensis TaxID=444605 RepID=A0AAD6W652_9ROSI|nr:hypothetical protein NC652_011209 [Populus alba x Populus x berolinensis]KAJ7000758.1 hypothetical protein NC653_011265 [Populus alba x Populus x berolinensis]
MMLVGIKDFDFNNEDVDVEVDYDVGGFGVGVGNGVNVKTCIYFDDGVGVTVDDVVVNICNDNEDDKEIKDENYIFYEEKGFDFVIEVKDDWIDNLFSDGSIGNNVYGSLDSKKYMEY